MTASKPGAQAALAARLSALLEPVVAAAGYDLEDLTVTAAGKRSVVRVAVDADDGIDLDDIAEASRAISQALDAADEQDPSLLGPSYVLEVSSPGVDRPLTQPRHWRRNVGRLVEARLVSQASVRGRVRGTDDLHVTLDVDGVEQQLPFSEIDRGVVQVEFNRPGSKQTPDDEEEDQ